jgi:dTDP-4-amino-4,6-dideoxygalactose transaminase
MMIPFNIPACVGTEKCFVEDAVKHDVDPLTMNIDVNEIEKAISARTWAIVPIHYAGVPSDMDRILEIAKAYQIVVIADAAQGVMSRYKGRALGSIGDIGAFSFHETKNLHCGEGGALLMARQAIFKKRMELWNFYGEQFRDLADQGRIELPFIPTYAMLNAHIYYIKVRDLPERTRLIAYAKERGVCLIFHYVPLHSSEAGRKFGTFVGEDKYTTKDSERLIRLPLYYSLSTAEQLKVVDVIHSFFKPSLRVNTGGWETNYVSASTKSLLFCYIVSSFNQNLLNA